MKRLNLIFTLVLMCYMPQAFPRMYQWIDPVNGTSQLSGKPPVWYRSTEGGPRVFVFERGGDLIDDTNILVTDSERERLRQQAFIRAEEDLQVAREKMIQAKRLEASYREEVQEVPVEEMPLSNESLNNGDADDVAQEDPVQDAQMINEMRALILDWERAREDEARALLE